ncbi:MAG: DUF4271 domain-containing protein [Bacteroidales bacterium]|nr:DUF4271 domain-containing protein [Bacteroidales bacterium]MBN2633706.1 DUF4271 domain-containing protein [Bacteroidales bacterium]
MNISDYEPENLSQDTLSRKPVFSPDDTAGGGVTFRQDASKSFPFLFIERNKNLEKDSQTRIIKSLRQGEPLAAQVFHYDWIIFIVLLSAFFYASLPAYSRKLFPGATRFFLFRGINDPEARETSELFHWQSTIFNLITFINISLFCFFALTFHRVLPGSEPPVIMWLITLAVVIISITIRHLTSIVTGIFSGQTEAFNEYIITIYQSYRYIAFGSVVLVSLISYTGIFSPVFFIVTGYIIFGILYIMRIIRLLMIFLKRRLSILYWILYLCALEILPAAIVIKSAASLF